MKSKISIWDCRRAIDIKGGLPLTMRGDLFDVDRPSAASVARWPPVKLLVTQLEVKQGQWIAGNIVFTRSGQNTSPSWRETSLRTTTSYMPRNNRTSTARIRLTAHAHKPLSRPLSGPSAAFPCRVGLLETPQAPKSS